MHSMNAAIGLTHFPSSLSLLLSEQPIPGAMLVIYSPILPLLLEMEMGERMLSCSTDTSAFLLQSGEESITLHCLNPLCKMSMAKTLLILILKLCCLYSRVSLGGRIEFRYVRWLLLSECRWRNDLPTLLAPPRSRGRTGAAVITVYEAWHVSAGRN